MLETAKSSVGQSAAEVESLLEDIQRRHAEAERERAGAEAERRAVTAEREALERRVEACRRNTARPCWSSASKPRSWPRR